MMSILLPILTSVLSMSHNEGARKTAGLVNSAASFIKRDLKNRYDR